jgi:anaerobic magnesium-protoporphyrin IX monomethyl ester cyclase
VRVMLVVPPELGDWDFAERMGDSPIELLGLGYVAAVARQNGYPVDILDCRFQALNYEAAVREILAANPRIVGITATWFLALVSLVKLSQGLRDAGYDGLIVAGGNPATFTFHNLLSRFPAVDVVVRGEGEFTFLELLQRLDEGLDWRQVQGIAYRENGQVVATAPRPLVADLDSLPLPARDNVATDGAPASLLFSRHQGTPLSTVVLSSRGCPFNCAFCSVQSFYGASGGPRWRSRNVADVVDEMAYLADEWGIRHFMFSDDNFIGSSPGGRARAREFADLLIQRNLGVKFNVECCVVDVEPSLFNHLRRAGLVQVHLGIESAAPRALKSFKKPTTVERSKKAISILKKLDIDCFPNFILLNPDTTLEELRQNLVFFKETGIYRVPMVFYLLYTSRLVLLAGTPAFEHYHKAGRTMPWRFPSMIPGSAEEERSILTATGVCFDFDTKDPGVAQFLKVLPDAISELTRRSFSLARIEEQHRLRAPGNLPPNAASERPSGDWLGLLSSISRWRANANTLALQLFERAIALAERGVIKDENVERHLEEFFSEIDRHDVRHFGKTVDELVQTAT